MVHGSWASVAAVGLSLLCATGCARLRPFRGPAEPEPRPAALPDDETRQAASEFPLSIAIEEDHVVRVIAGQTTCSGALIDGERVLTAHHCIADRDKFGEIVARDVRPDQIRVELGGDYLPWGEVGVRAVVAPRCGHATGDGDIAILVLERKLVGVPTLKTVLDRAPEVGEKIEPVGFGRCALSLDGIRRKHRAAGSVESVRPGHFRLHASICPGDSGGPAITKSGKVVGVVSASAMDGVESTLEKTDFTRLDRWRPVFSNSQLITEGASPAELPPIDCGN
jgi:V8-like Glu-specific endopeptidase